MIDYYKKLCSYLGRDPGVHEVEFIGDNQTGKITDIKLWAVNDVKKPTLQELAKIDTKKIDENRNKIIEILTELKTLDNKMIRAVEDVISSNNHKYYNEIKAQKDALRQEYDVLTTANPLLKTIKEFLR